MPSLLETDKRERVLKAFDGTAVQAGLLLDEFLMNAKSMAEYGQEGLDISPYVSFSGEPRSRTREQQIYAENERNGYKKSLNEIGQDARLVERYWSRAGSDFCSVTEASMREDLKSRCALSLLKQRPALKGFTEAKYREHLRYLETELSTVHLRLPSKTAEAEQRRVHEAWEKIKDTEAYNLVDQLFKKAIALPGQWTAVVLKKLDEKRQSVGNGLIEYRPFGQECSEAFLEEIKAANRKDREEMVMKALEVESQKAQEPSFDSAEWQDLVAEVVDHTNKFRATVPVPAVPVVAVPATRSKKRSRGVSTLERMITSGYLEHGSSASSAPQPGAPVPAQPTVAAPVAKPTMPIPPPLRRPRDF